VDDEVVHPLFRVSFLRDGGYDDWFFWSDSHGKSVCWVNRHSKRSQCYILGRLPRRRQ
jgi:hypothetical protein